MTSKVQPVADYWTHDVKMTSKVQPAADYWTVDQGNLEKSLCYFWWAEIQRAKRRNSFMNGKIFWMNNKAIIKSGFRRIWTILQISDGVIHFGLRPPRIIPSLICRILHILLSLIQLLLIIIHQMLLLACDWPKRVTWRNIPQLKLYSPIFKTARVAKKIWRIIKTIVAIWGENMLGYLSLDIICSS